MYPTITIFFGRFPRAPSRMSFLLKCASPKPWGFSFFFKYFFQKSQACVGSILESQLKSKTSHSLIPMGFIRLVTWSGVRGLWKKGSKRLKECLRVNWVRTSRVLPVLYSFQLLGWALLLLSYTLILISLLCLPCKIWRSLSLFFLHSPLVDFIFFFFSLFPNFMHVLFALLFPLV